MSSWEGVNEAATKIQAAERGRVARANLPPKMSCDRSAEAGSSHQEGFLPARQDLDSDSDDTELVRRNSDGVMSRQVTHAAQHIYISSSASNSLDIGSSQPDDNRRRGRRLRDATAFEGCAGRPTVEGATMDFDYEKHSKPQNHMLSDIDEIIFGRDLDMSNNHRPNQSMLPPTPGVYTGGSGSTLAAPSTVSGGAPSWMHIDGVPKGAHNDWRPGLAPHPSAHGAGGQPYATVRDVPVWLQGPVPTPQHGGYTPAPPTAESRTSAASSVWTTSSVLDMGALPTATLSPHGHGRRGGSKQGGSTHPPVGGAARSHLTASMHRGGSWAGSHHPSRRPHHHLFGMPEEGMEEEEQPQPATSTGHQAGPAVGALPNLYGGHPPHPHELTGQGARRISTPAQGESSKQLQYGYCQGPDTQTSTWGMADSTYPPISHRGPRRLQQGRDRYQQSGAQTHR